MVTDIIETKDIKEAIDILLLRNQYLVNEHFINLDYFIKSLARKRGECFGSTINWLNDIAKTSSIAAFNIVVREIAIQLDKRYIDHIENSDKIFIISTFDGRIHEICKKYIKNYRNFAAFRTIEDAKFACRLLRNQLKYMFAEHAERKQKNQEFYSMSGWRHSF